MSEKTYEAKQNEFSASAMIDAPAKVVFPLLCPTREYDWVPNWSCELIWSKSGFAELGAVFTTEHKEDGVETWVISAYEPHSKIAFVRFRSNVVLRLDIELHEADRRTRLVITKSTTSVSPRGEQYVEKLTQKSTENYAKHFELALNHYLRNGRAIGNAELRQQMHKQG